MHHEVVPITHVPSGGHLASLFRAWVMHRYLPLYGVTQGRCGRATGINRWMARPEPETGRCSEAVSYHLCMDRHLFAIEASAGMPPVVVMPISR